jgi:hypothetical protein
MCHRITDEGWNYPKLQSGSLTGQTEKFVVISFLALVAKFKILAHICHLMSYYFLELLPIFVILNTPVLFPHLIQPKKCKPQLSFRGKSFLNTEILLLNSVIDYFAKLWQYLELC